MESFDIIERYVTKQELLLLAKTILIAQELREASWTDSTHTKTTREICKEAIESTSLDVFWLFSITYWLSCFWNTSQDWAKQIIKNLEQSSWNH